MKINWLPFFWILMTLFITPAFANGLSISPVNLNIPAGKQTALLKLYNRSDAPLVMQVRILDWAASNQLSAQDVVVASPPAIRIAPGARQLVRIVNTGTPAATGVEKAYRLLLDEIPDPEAPRGNGLLLQMRYSLPLFVGGADLDSRRSGDIQSLKTLLQQALSYRLVLERDRLLEVINNGALHARIAKLRYLDGEGASHSLVPGLLGYALPGERAGFALHTLPPADMTGLVAEINGVDIHLQSAGQ